MENNAETNSLFTSIIAKASLKQDVYQNTYNTFTKFKTVIKNLVKEYQEADIKSTRNIPFEYKNRGEFEVELIINIYNFLGDSFKYKRINDIGYLIGRVFVNKDMHYFIEGKREIGYLFRSFDIAFMDDQAAKTIITSAIRYALNFDLLTPPYEEVKILSVYEIQTTLDNMKIKTGKRLGFRFQADADEEETKKE